MKWKQDFSEVFLPINIWMLSIVPNVLNLIRMRIRILCLNIFTCMTRILNYMSCFSVQILRQLAPDVSYRSLVALGIASIQGLPVASFEKDDAERLLFFYQSSEKDGCANHNIVFSRPPIWLKPPPPTRKRSESSQGASPDIDDGVFSGQGAIKKVDEEEKDRKMVNGISTPLTPARQRLKVSAMRPIPQVRRHRMTPFCGPSEMDGFGGAHVEASVPLVPMKRSSIASSSATQRKSFSSSALSKQVISLNPLPLKKHACSRGPVQTCSEVSFPLSIVLNILFSIF